MGDPFYVQEAAKEPWHRESDDDCELMLCGKRISVELKSTKVQHSWGPRKCPDCWMEVERLRRIASFAPSSPR